MLLNSLDQQKQSAPPLPKHQSFALPNISVVLVASIPISHTAGNRPQSCLVNWKTIRPFMCMVIHLHKCLQRYSLTGTGLSHSDGSTRWIFTRLVFLTRF